MRTSLLVIAVLSTEMICSAQTSQAGEAAKTKTGATAFEVATVKPMDPRGGGLVGFMSYKGGKVVIGSANLKMLIRYAFDVEDFQISGGPEWITSERYDVVGLPPADVRDADGVPYKATPNDRERQMIRSLLLDRFGLQYHRGTSQKSVYLLTRGTGKLLLEDAKDKSIDPRGGVPTKDGGIVDGEAFGRNVTMPFLAKQISGDLDRAVLDQTGLTGSYDFHVGPSDPTNTDVTTGIMEAIQHIGLSLKGGKGPVETIFVDKVSKPTPN